MGWGAYWRLVGCWIASRKVFVLGRGSVSVIGLETCVGSS